MTDDIVTRLRDEQWVWVSESALREDAADEIERLRAEASRLTLLANLWEAEFNAAVDALTGKAVRGE